MHPKCTRIIPVSKWLVIPIYKTFRPFGRGITLLRGLTITMVINHILAGMILQVVVSRAAWSTPPALPQAVCPTMKRRTSCTPRPKSRMPIPRVTTCASTFCVMFGGKQGHYARWHVRLWVSLPCRLSPDAELGVWCFTCEWCVEHVTPSDSHHLLMTSVLAVACFFLLPVVPSQGSNDTRSISCFMCFQNLI